MFLKGHMLKAGSYAVVLPGRSRSFVRGKLLEGNYINGENVFEDDFETYYLLLHSLGTGQKP